MKEQEELERIKKLYQDVDGTDYDCEYISLEMSKQCALIHVNGIIEVLEELGGCWECGGKDSVHIDYNKVKSIIESK